MKPLNLLAPLTLTSLAFSSITCQTAIANDIIRIDQLNAQERVVELDVTPFGLAIDFGTQISSVTISHRSNIVYRGMDGTLCSGDSRCSGSPPTILFVRKIPKINFKDEQAVSGNYSFLYVDTASGMYRFKFKPVNKNPQYTKVEIENTVQPLFSR